MYVYLTCKCTQIIVFVSALIDTSDTTLLRTYSFPDRYYHKLVAGMTASHKIYWQNFQYNIAYCGNIAFRNGNLEPGKVTKFLEFREVRIL